MNKSNTSIIISIIVAGLIISGAIYFSSSSSKTGGKAIEQNINNVSIVDGKQIIEIKAKGGFLPVHSTAKAGIPTILRVDTNGTFDCSSIVRIPSMNITENLPMSGTTDIDIGIQKAGIFQGTCGMGMYPFDVEFI
ncbi:MAG: cupredoxin domain-containing protein [Minisyncoccia bacterium]